MYSFITRHIFQEETWQMRIYSIHQAHFYTLWILIVSKCTTFLAVLSLFVSIIPKSFPHLHLKLGKSLLGRDERIGFLVQFWLFNSILYIYLQFRVLVRGEIVIRRKCKQQTIVLKSCGTSKRAIPILFWVGRDDSIFQ